ncbi:MAG: hypothetical protein M3Y56_08190, partial [Armatimonadota bacterium]|nr:hypothetical protein [Armatimonadota bacterium]
YKVNASHAPVLVNGREASFADLTPGISASIVAIAMDQKTLEIEAREVNAVAPNDQEVALSTTPQPPGIIQSSGRSTRPAPVPPTRSTATPIVEHPATTRQLVLRPRITDRPHTDSHDTAETANTVPSEVTPKAPAILAPVPSRPHNAEDTSANTGETPGAGETPGDGTPASPQDSNGGRHRRRYHDSSENGSPDDGAATDPLR